MGEEQQGLARNKKRGATEPMLKRQFQRIVKAFRRNGGSIQMGSNADEHLARRQVSGTAMNADTILFVRRPDRATVFEELIHATQFRNGEIDGTHENWLKCEIAVQRKLLRFSKEYRLTEPEIIHTKGNLAGYEEELAQRKGARIMAKVVDSMRIAEKNKLYVTLLGAYDVRFGDFVHDERGRRFRIDSVGMVHYKNPADIGKYTGLLLDGDGDIGSEITFG